MNEHYHPEFLWIQKGFDGLWYIVDNNSMNAKQIKFCPWCGIELK